MALKTIARSSVRIVPQQLRSHIKNVPLIGSVLRWYVNTQLSGRAFVHTVDAGPAKGIAFEITLPEDKGIWTGCYEEDFSSYVAETVEPGMVGFDIGAWHGFFTGIMLSKGASEVVMFEPLATNIACLKRFMELNTEYKLQLQPVALGSKRGSTKLLQPAGSSMAKLATSPFKMDLQDKSGVDVSIETVDRLVADGCVPPPDLFKVDIEGAELMMLEGAQETLSIHKPIILAEIHSGELMAGVHALLTRHGYSVEILETSDTAMREQDAFQIRALVKKSRVLRRPTKNSN